MLITKPRFETFAEYLQYEDNSEGLYELFNGELIEMPPESGLNYQIANRLFLVFALMLGTDRIRGHGLELEVRGEPKNRYPDLTIIREEHIKPGEIQRERDYIAKRIQYQDCGIPEYWIVDPQTQTILVLELRGNTYTEIGNFSNDDLVKSSIFNQLNIKVSQVFN
ncbi:MAG: Uma2 family endonuclease [Microcystis aeruginosa G11-06]|nr:Uma2 family endonuclease [Microcystis aeruginosa G11-06]